jgi:phospholipase/lecithinase/hemolysin
MPTPGIDFSRILFFGDSLTDNGNLFGITGGAAPVSPPYALRFSNGATYAEVLPGLIAVESADVGPTGWTFGGDDNFAYGGARAIANPGVTAQDPDLDSIPDLNTQLAEFSLRYPTGAPDGTAALLLVGNNDYFNYTPAKGDPTAFVGQVLAKVADAAITLATTGNVDKIILLTLPNVAATPLVALNPAAAAIDGLIDGHNAGLRTVAAGLAAAGVAVEIIDNNAFVREIAADAETFGFLAPLSQSVILPNGAANPAVAGFDADEIAFFDSVHPTAAAHGVTASFVAAALSADTVTFAAVGSNAIEFGTGRDLVFAGGGNDRISTGSGVDIIFGGTGHDRITAGDGNDVASGGSGNDAVSGGSGDDVVAGNAGNDFVEGGSGNDIVIAGRGNDALFAGSGNDRLYVTNEAGVFDFDLADGGTGVDTLVIEVDALSLALRGELTAFTPGGFDLFSSVGLVARSIERVEIVIDGVVVASGGVTAPILSASQADAIATADLWGLL